MNQGKITQFRHGERTEKQMERLGKEFNIKKSAVIRKAIDMLAKELEWKDKT